MATSKQKAASQRNGRLSRGPKTDAGKRAASLNATRHGLSARSDLNALNPHLAEIEQLILAEVQDKLTARAIAGKIFDYERTEAHQSRVAAKEAEGKERLPRHRGAQKAAGRKHGHGHLAGADD